MEAPSCDPHHSLPSLLYPLPCSSMGKALFGMVWVWVWVRYCVLSWWVPGLPPVSSAACCLPGHQQHGIVCPAVSRDNLAHCVPWLSSQATCGTTTTHNPYFSIGLVFCCFGHTKNQNKQTKKISSNSMWNNKNIQFRAVLHYMSQYYCTPKR